MVPDGKDSENGIRMDVPHMDSAQEMNLKGVIADLENDIKTKDNRIVELTAMCYTLAKRLRNESFADNITAVQRQQMAELAMNSLNMTADVWVLVHRSEEQPQQPSS